MRAAPLRRANERRGGSRSRLSAFRVVVVLVAGAGPASAQSEIVLELPGEPGPIPSGFEEHVFEIEIDPNRLPQNGLLLTEVDLGELSPTTPVAYASGTIQVAVRSPWGFFPPYQIEARARTAISSGAGDFTTQDVGMGISNVIAANPVVNPQFDYDPTLAPKDGDDEPLFQGTIASLPLTPPRMWLYRTEGTFAGTWNYFLLTFAVGPQFYSPTGEERMRVEIVLRRT